MNWGDAGHKFSINHSVRAGFILWARWALDQGPGLRGPRIRWMRHSEKGGGKKKERRERKKEIERGKKEKDKRKKKYYCP